MAAGAGVMRWTVVALTTSPVLMSLVQPLHGLTFALLHLACMQLIVQVVPENTTGIGDLRVQEEAGALEAGCSNDDYARPCVKLTVRPAIDEIGAIYQAGLLVDRDLADDRVRNQIEIAGSQGCRKKQIE